MLILRFCTTYPPFWETKLLELGSPVQESGTSPYLRSLKILPIDFPSPKNHSHIDIVWPTFHVNNGDVT